MHDHDLGLQHDLNEIRRRLTRRRLALGTLAGLGSLALPRLSRAQAGAQESACTVIPSETAGPFPANGSGRFTGSAPNALALSGIVRSDIRSSIAGAQGVAAGVALQLTLELVNTSAACTPLAGLAVYLWQCDREGRYSLYSPGVVEQNYLRGVQAADAAGRVHFMTTFPGCYPGRMPHLHFEIYRSLETASSAANRLKTSQLALPPAVCEEVYASAPGYGDSVANLRGISFATDGIFRDGVSTQLAAVQGTVAGGMQASLRVGIAV